MNHAEKIAFLAPSDRSALLGLEIGARDAPLLRRGAGPVLYADYLDTEALRRETHGGQVVPENIVPVDIVTGERRLSEVLGRRVDYIVASHVAEHVPDLLGWFIDLYSVLPDGGTLGLAIPDRRFTFDLFRRESTIAEAVEAWLAAWRRPSPRQIFDSAWQAVSVDYAALWRGAPPAEAEEASRESRLAPALALTREVAASGRYNDAHCWVFTPASFLALIGQAARIKLFPFTLDRFAPTPEGGYEFLILLRKAAASPEAILRTIAAARETLQASPGEAAYRLLAAREQPDVAPWVAALRAAEQEAARLRETIAIMRGSRLWRMMEPARRIGGWVRRRP